GKPSHRLAGFADALHTDATFLDKPLGIALPAARAAVSSYFAAFKQYPDAAYFAVEAFHFALSAAQSDNRLASTANGSLSEVIADACADDAKLLDDGLRPEELAVRPIWPTDFPDAARNAWIIFEAALLKENSDWKVWTDW